MRSLFENFIVRASFHLPLAPTVVPVFYWRSRGFPSCTVIFNYQEVEDETRR